MSAECNACYAASTEPAWIAALVVNARTDHPCPSHSPQTTLSDREEPR